MPTVRRRYALAADTLALHCGDTHAAPSLAGQLNFEPPAIGVPRGQVTQLTLTLSNDGSVPLQTAGTTFTYRSFGPASTVFPVDPANVQPCPASILDLSPRPGEAPLVVYSIHFPDMPLLPGQARQCTIGLRVSEQARAPFELRVTFAGVVDGQIFGVTRSAFFGLGDPPPLVPTLSSYVLWLLGAAMAVLGWAAMRR